MAELVDVVPEAQSAGWAMTRPRISWGAVFGGAVSSLGIWLLLYAFGMAVGLSSIDASDAGSLKASGIFTGVWGLVSPLVALFVGGLVAGRLSGTRTRGAGAAHGLVMWGLASIVGTYLVITALGAIIGGAATVGRGALAAGGAAVGMAAKETADDGVAGWLGLDADDALAPVNRRLQTEGKPAISASELQAATRDVAQNAIRQGHFDRAMLVSALQRNTKLSRADANEIADRVEAQWNQSRSKLHDAAENAGQKALAAAKASGKAFWGVFGAMLLGLCAALGGGAIGSQGMSHRRRDRIASRPSPATPPSSPVATRREVYP